MRVRSALPLVGILVLTGCGQSPEGQNSARPAPPAGNTAAAAPLNAASADAPPAGAAANAAENESLDSGTDARTIASNGRSLEFSYAWPEQAAAIPELDRWFRGNGEALHRKWRGEAAEDEASARADGYPFRKYSYEEGYGVVADTARFLVLQSDGYVYTGGAHGMPVVTAVIWDREAKRRLATAALMDVPRLADLSRTRFCAALDRQREERRGEPVRKDDPDEIAGFNSCVDMTKQLLLPISSRGRALDTLRVVIGPYEAGPYAEGTYVIELPLTARLLATVAPAYRDAFAAR